MFNWNDEKIPFNYMHIALISLRLAYESHLISNKDKQQMVLLTDQINKLNRKIKKNNEVSL